MSTISIFGLGYVGAVCTACFAKKGHTVIGMDVSEGKVGQVQRGESPIVEEQLAELLSEGVAEGRISATTDARQAVFDSQVSFICVGTPSDESGFLNTCYLKTVCEDIGLALRDKDDAHLVVIRSTVLPGLVRGDLLPILEKASGKKAGVDFMLAVNPEFLRESTAIHDFFNPPMTVVGGIDDEASDALAVLYQGLDAPMVKMTIEEAELVKYACNSWHATKVSFANEIGNIAKQAGVDGRRVMEVVCMDNKLNLSSYYMKPGFAYGGSCLPKDVRALNAWCDKVSLLSPLLASLSTSNDNQVERAMAMIRESGMKKVGLLGLSFKPGTDDLRESPLISLAAKLLSEDYRLAIYDSNVNYASKNSPVAEQLWNSYGELLECLVEDMDQLVDSSEVVVVGHATPTFKAVADTVNSGRLLIDLCGYLPGVSSEDRQGICW
ncbi:UDP-glucose/GDP-mannose dehydrogenase family protein [Alcanivorax sp.]|jgi:GDP-mannose 6-dehydrogenase|uniref:UDP-glucose/GDP-mannose dehydrogenase family protein n=1 Tax=Alcanivorax sp. TaxID=1872427 RepID=UPI0032D8C56B